MVIVMLLAVVMVMSCDALWLPCNGPTPVGCSCRTSVDRCLILLQIGWQGRSPLVLLSEGVNILQQFTFLTPRLLSPHILASPLMTIASSSPEHPSLLYHNTTTNIIILVSCY